MQLPGPLRAAVGLVAAAADEARHLPDRAIELPMLAVSTALQASLRLQQRYARLAARGDAVLTSRRAPDDPPRWARFDDDPTSGAALRDPDRGDSVARSTTRAARTAGTVIEEVFGVDTPDNGAIDVDQEPGESDGAHDISPVPVEEPKKSAPKKSAQTTGAARTSAVKRSNAARVAAKKSTKTVSRPRHTPPSRFDSTPDVGD